MIEVPSSSSLDPAVCLSDGWAKAFCFAESKFGVDLDQAVRLCVNYYVHTRGDALTLCSEVTKLTACLTRQAVRGCQKSYLAYTYH